ncbi:MAG: EF-hand domain-containing protein [Aquabacterium sp.]|uniref:EF-hand domain-containing protein n=1 Tax=Aquabacterium sp. TaxID=1872578 RepID=UPI00271B35F6|nr:EF-hand domain-containing protein [Aquabacterium sp.]MDO9005100.1 EF-hand domain-containing protein [Aquabacterium sp.]
MSSISGVSSSASAWSAMSTSRASRQQEMFNKVDSDGSGGVDATELQSMLDDIAKHTGTSSTTTAADALTKMDSNGDGSLDSSEMEAGMKSLMPEPSSTMAFAQARNGEGGPKGAGGPPPASGGSSSTDIDPLDTNEDGTVSEQERAAGEMKNAIQNLLKAAATDGDKKIGTSDMVLKEYAKAASNAASSQSAGATLSVAA